MIYGDHEIDALAERIDHALSFGGELPHGNRVARIASVLRAWHSEADVRDQLLLGDRYERLNEALASALALGKARLAEFMAEREHPAFASALGGTRPDLEEPVSPRLHLVRGDS